MDATGRRLQVLSQQLGPSPEHGDQPQLERVHTSGNEPSAEFNQLGADEPYAISLPEKLTPEGPWHVYRSAFSPKKLMSTFEAPDDNVFTLYDNWETAIARYPHVPALGTRKRDIKGNLGPYTWLTYSQAGDIRTSIGSGLLQLGIQPKATVGLYSVNCKEWVLVDAAAHAYSMTSVPLYDTLGPDAVEYICNHAELSMVACSAAVLPVMTGCIARCPTVKLLVVWGTGTARLPELPEASHCRIVTLDQVESLGRRHPRAHIPPRPSDLSTICYTSGTTGTPKGAMLSHANLVADAAGTVALLEEWNPGDKHISYLPLAHIYERNNMTVAVHLGGSVGFYSGNVQELLDDIVALKPQIFVSVPRLWNRIYDRVMATVREANPVSRSLFERAYAYKKAAIDSGDLSGGRWGPFWDRLVFSKIRAKLGGEIKYMTSGASPISAEVMQFLRICFSCHVLEGYGMTETSCTMTITRPDDPTIGHVGAPIPCCELKLVDIPEMNYVTSDKPYPRGEICVRGPTVFQGYFKDEAQTRDVIDSDGWLHTGDVGTWLPGGRLRIIDRKKNIFKLAQGEYIAPEKIENVYARSPFVMQAFVYGDSLRSQLVAVVVPDPEVLLPWARERGLPQDMPALCREPAAVSAVHKSMAEEGRIAQLRGFEHVQAITLIPEPFTVENNLLTPTFKLKRPQVKAAYQAVIDAMYHNLPVFENGTGVADKNKVL
uniref:Long-chain-fatty-acid--CoA ligase n=1 Tax=Chromochloris zofingiensis TaxID=31302 RepID=A0A6G9KEM8_9CHLO|nr:long-chain acyl-CoA synthetase 5 [Chromochloris zofingiensis]